MKTTIVVIQICLVFFTTTVISDEIYLKNGDRITGKIKTLADGKITFESEFAGTVSIDLSNIATFNTNEEVEVHLEGGTVFKQRIVRSTTGSFAIAGDEKLKPQEFDVETILAINPAEKLPPAWHGEISAGMTSTRGNSVTDTQSFSVNLHKRTEKDRSLFTIDYIRNEYEDQDTGEKKKSQDEWKMRGKYDYFFTERFFGYLDGRYERDSIAELDRRVIIGTGGGYQWVESEEFNFSTEAGIASLYEKYDNQTDSSSQVSGQIGYHLDKKLTQKLMFINDLTYYPGLEKFSDYFLTTTAELRADITQEIFTNFKVVFDYDATPSQDADSTDVKYIWGMGYKF
ncbi:MAG: DUF481 domain-containing protein [Sedimentisphaerales bacterium]|nr:DUF481 domain-containing protein [Sedimentisphaerales bacterium]